MKKKLGEPMTCGVCLEVIIRNSPNQQFCAHLCKPHDDALIECTICKDKKHPSAFYDYRYNIEGKLVRRCKECTSKANAITNAKRR